MAIFEAIREVAAPNYIAVADGGDLLSFARVGLSATTYMDAGAFGCLGVGVPFAIAAALAFPGRQVISVNGDGAYGINAMEIDTAVRHGAGAVFIVSNNAAWNIERFDQEFNYGGRVVGTTLRHSDYAAMARALGAHGERVEDPADLANALRRALANAPAVIDVVTSQGAVSSDAQKGLGFVPDYQALTAWDEAERRRREVSRMDLSLTGKRALVTGASGGLGLHFARVLAGPAPQVTLAARRERPGGGGGGGAAQGGLMRRRRLLDVTAPDSVAGLFAARPFDVVVNNAGIAGEGAALDMDIDAFQRVIDTNLTGVFAVAQAAARGMKAVGGGSIVNIASILGLRVRGPCRGLCRVEGGGGAADEGARARMGAARGAGQRALPGLHRDADQRGLLRDRGGGGADPAHPAAAARGRATSTRRSSSSPPTGRPT
jgi:NAD(P)-dependent dehydrogenase (short-subunit alcohol dehydrogenase family)